MEHLFITIYRFFRDNRIAFWLVFLIVSMAAIVAASRISLEENITKFFPDDDRVKKLNYIFRNSPAAERIVVMVSTRDSANELSTDSLIAATEAVAMEMDTSLSRLNAKVKSQVDDERIFDVSEQILRHLPVFLNEADYLVLDSLTRPDGVRDALTRNYRQLLSPSGIFLKQIITKDPVGLSYLAFKKLRELQYDANFEIYNGYIITKDHRHVVFFVQPPYASNETGKNKEFVHELSRIVHHANKANQKTLVSYFGATSVAVGNAEQLHDDSVLTLTILSLLLILIVFIFFRDWRVLPLIFVPVVFGGIFSLACIYLIKGSVSILAVAAGSVILGIAVNYALHFLVHQRYNEDKETVLKDLVGPLTLGSVTTVLAFFCLQFTNAAVLKDVGLFAGFSLIGAALCALIFLPQIAPAVAFNDGQIITLPSAGPRTKKVFVAIILIMTPVFYFLASDVRFNNDMSRLNFMSDESEEAQRRLERINPASLHTMYVASEGGSLQEALRKNEGVYSKMEQMRLAGSINRHYGISALVVSDSLQQLRVEKWNVFWNDSRRTRFLQAVHEHGGELKFSSLVLARADSIVRRQYQPMDSSMVHSLITTFFQDNIIQKETTVVINLLNVLPENRETVQKTFAAIGHDVFDRQMVASLFVGYVHEDFLFIVTFTSVLVFFVLLISFGRIELTLVTFMPMLITWIWILGIMALFGIEFNIVNVMISTFIFGLGDDYSIFVMDGLLQEYKSRNRTLPAVRMSIFLSALTTICGLGVLIFAEHPALRSIAAIAIIGVACVFVMSQTIEPLLFEWLVTRRTRRGMQPRTFRGMFFTLMTYSIFIVGSLLLTVVGVMLKLVPFARKRIQLIYHMLISCCTTIIIKAAGNIDTRVTSYAPDVFVRPGVVIANHSSFLDILVTTMLHPKIILLTNKWVYNSPVFGGVVRLADYYPVMEGADGSIDKLRTKIENGYSVVIFPEGTRSTDGQIRRFHKGAFYLAEKLKVPVFPLLIHGAAQRIPKSTMYVNDGILSLTILPAIEHDDHSFGRTYSERTKSIARHFKEKHASIQAQLLTPRSVKTQLINNYRYKGPVLEWYLRIKLRLENNYQIFHDLIPANAKVVDLGCGYGFLSYMLQFLSEERLITGIDYDEEKISVARNGYLRTDRLNFICADITNVEIPLADVIIIADVLHYLPEDAQFKLIENCFNRLFPGGKLIIRDGDRDQAARHKRTMLTEFFSVKILKFNKANEALNFMSGKQLIQFGESHGFETRVTDNSNLTSNRIFELTRKI